MRAGPRPHPHVSPVRRLRGARRGCLTLPYTLALRVYRPAREDRVVDTGIERAQIARTAIGVLASLWLLFAYPLREQPGDLVFDKVAEILLSAGVLIVTGPIALTVFAIAVHPTARHHYRGRFHEPLRAMGTFFGTVAVIIFIITTSATGPGAGVFIAGPVLLFAIPFCMIGAVLAVHFVFRTADVHEILPPLVSPVLVWSMLVFQIFDDAPVVAPLAVRAVFLIVPPLSVTALSLWELHRLRTRYGITIRRALGRAARD